jgi:hypothetical protein
MSTEILAYKILVLHNITQSATFIYQRNKKKEHTK